MMRQYNAGTTHSRTPHKRMTNDATLPRPPPGGSTQPQQGDPVWDQWADSHSAHHGEP
jgi:hypothetical protein